MSRGGHARHVLVAEDDPAMRRLVVEALRKEGHSVTDVSDGGALRAAVFESPVPVDLLVSDIRLPGCSGLAVLEDLRAAGRSIPVLLMTAFGDGETRDRVERLGASLLDKPFNLRTLCEAVRTLTSAA